MGQQVIQTVNEFLNEQHLIAAN